MHFAPLRKLTKEEGTLHYSGKHLLYIVKKLYEALVINCNSHTVMSIKSKFYNICYIYSSSSIYLVNGGMLEVEN